MRRLLCDKCGREWENPSKEELFIKVDEIYWRTVDLCDTCFQEFHNLYYDNWMHELKCKVDSWLSPDAREEERG